MQSDSTTIGWIAFWLLNIPYAALLVYVFVHVKTRKHSDFSLRSCICGRRAPSMKLARVSYGFGAGFVMLYSLAVIFPAAVIGHPSNFQLSDVPWIVWALLAFYLSTGLVPLVKFAASGHSAVCAARRGLFGLAGFWHYGH
jgi:hypothetical protein